MKASGINLHLWVSKAELMNAKQGGTTLRASKSKTKDADIEITIMLEACDVLDDEIRVNLALVQNNLEELGKMFGETIGNEFQKLLKDLG